MNITIVTFVELVKHTPIAVRGDFEDAVEYLRGQYDFGYLLPLRETPATLELHFNPVLDYLGAVRVVNGNMQALVATLNRVNLKNFPDYDGMLLTAQNLCAEMMVERNEARTELAKANKRIAALEARLIVPLYDRPAFPGGITDRQLAEIIKFRRGDDPVAADVVYAVIHRGITL